MIAIGAPVWVCCAAGDQPPGSVGALAANADGLWLISANHVLAANGARQPMADPSHGVYVRDRRVSRTIVFAPLHRAGNRADAAACLLTPQGDFRPLWPAGWTPRCEPHLPGLRTKVKVFVAGQDRFGVVSHRGSFRVDMQDCGLPVGLGQVEFRDCLLVRTTDPLFKKPGNSGMLVVTAEDCRPVGLVTGTSLEKGSDYVVISLLAHVLDVLGLPEKIYI